MFDAIRRMFKTSPRRDRRVDTGLSFDGLNPLLAKQLSELESQLGQLAQVQFELSQERQRMRVDMEALKKAVSQPNGLSITDSDNDARQ
jgi:regulator of replication initiation timing